MLIMKKQRNLSCHISILAFLFVISIVMVTSSPLQMLLDVNPNFKSTLSFNLAHAADDKENSADVQEVEQEAQTETDQEATDAEEVDQEAQTETDQEATDAEEVDQEAQTETDQEATDAEEVDQEAQTETDQTATDAEEVDQEAQTETDQTATGTNIGQEAQQETDQKITQTATQVAKSSADPDSEDAGDVQQVINQIANQAASGGGNVNQIVNQICTQIAVGNNINQVLVQVSNQVTNNYFKNKIKVDIDNDRDNDNVKIIKKVYKRDNSCPTQSDSIQLKGKILPKGVIVLADFEPCELKDGRATLNVPDTPNLKFVVLFIDKKGNNHEGAIVTKQKVQSLSKDSGLYVVNFDNKMTGIDPVTGKKITLDEINGLALYNTAKKSLNFKSGNSLALTAVLNK